MQEKFDANELLPRRDKRLPSIVALVVPRKRFLIS
jgi:hypothetical protein